MKNKRTKNRMKITSLLFVLLILGGCSEWLENPLKDEETGENVNLLILDFNFFNTRMQYKLLDASDNSLITLPAEITFSGTNANDIVTFSGDKKSSHTTTQGQIELTIDPNVSISESTPFKFAVNVEVPGYNKLSKGFQFNIEGKKTIELKLSKVTDGESTKLEGETGDDSVFFIVPDSFSKLKSATVETKPHKINYEISYDDIANFKDINENTFFENGDAAKAFLQQEGNSIRILVTPFTNYLPETDVIEHEGESISVLFKKLETGKLDSIQIESPEWTKTANEINGGVIKSYATYLENPEPDVFGFAVFQEGSWNILGEETEYDSLNFEYTVVKASLEELCSTGSSITFSSNAKSSFSIDADVYDTEGTMITTINFKGNFPQTFEVENTPNRAVKIFFRDNNPSFQPIDTLKIDNFCEGNYNVDVDSTYGYKEYQIVLKAICPNNPTVAVAPTYSAEVKIADSTDPWQGVDMDGGVVDILGLPKKEYKLRLLWNNEWEYSTYYTEFDEEDNYIHDHGSKTKVESERMEDGRMRILVEQIFNQDVCNDMGW